MKKIEAIIRSEKVGEVKAAHVEAPAEGFRTRVQFPPPPPNKLSNFGYLAFFCPSKSVTSSLPVSLIGITLALFRGV